MSEHKELRQPQLPWNKAMEFAWKSVRIRLGRSIVTAGGVFLGIAFLASVLITKAIAGADITPDEAARNNWLVALSLLVCTVGITNSMLMSVTERYREIGTMKCLGAMNGFVLRIFMIEAAAMGLLASALGAVIGMGLMVLVKMLVGVPKEAMEAGKTWHGALTGGDAGGIFLLCAGIGTLLTMVAAFFPARYASQIPPAGALRMDV
ncbi:MAG: FtsX-like permease family protein [Armatimonas sp.]